MIWVKSTKSYGVAVRALVIGDGISSKIMEYANNDVPSLLKKVRFFSKETDIDRDTYWAHWNCELKDISANTSPFDVSFGNLDIGTGWQRIEQGQYLVARLRDGSWRFEPIGLASVTEIHTIIFNLNMRVSTSFGLSFAARCTKYFRNIIALYQVLICFKCIE